MTKQNNNPAHGMRWTVKATYRSDDGDFINTFYLDELFSVHGIIEASPSFEALSGITISYNLGKPKTVQQTLME